MRIVRRPRVQAAAAAIAVVAALTGCTSGGPPRTVVQTALPSGPLSVTPSGAQADPLAPYYSQKLGWRDCGDGFSCAWLEVPLDYSQPARAIELAVVKLATTAKSRVGSLVLNPGGPGGSGVDYARGAGKSLPPVVRSHFDIVGFDPRGIGQSRPAIRCVSSAQLDEFVAQDPVPHDGAQKQALLDESRTFANGCAARSGELLAHVGTVDVARDLDVLRAALGDAKLTYLGKSYGTLLGALYAEQFPAHVRALVLDGAVDPSLTGEQLNEQQAVGFETAFHDFLQYCLEHSCPLGTDIDSASRGLTDFFDQVEAHPLPAPKAAHGPLMESHAVLAVAAALYSPSPGWAMLRDALAAAKDGDGSALMELADSLNGRNPDGTYTNLLESNTAINCVDRPYPHDMAAYDASATVLARIAPHFGAAVAYSGLSCAFWPVRPVDAPRTLHVTAAPPILVIGTKNDPATPYQWAQSLAGQLAGSALLTFTGDGHTVYGDGRSTCIDEATDAYLVDLRLPPAGQVCS
jgi:pimeloyl-ACP methyl ester carboxylesterase